MELTDRKIKKSVNLNMPAADLWTKWTTHEGLLSFFGRDNKIELIPGGAFEIYFLTDNPYGLRGSEGCKILSYLPERMLSFSWNAPSQFPVIRSLDYKTWVVVEFNKVSKSETNVTLTHLGWPSGDDWNQVYDYFDNAWGSVLEQLKDSAVK